MRFHAAAMIAGVIWAAPAAAQTEPVTVADAFFKAVLNGDVAATRSLRTADAALGGGDIAVPMAETEEVLLRFSQLKCSIGKLALSPEPVASDLLRLSSVKPGDARWVEGTMSCPTTEGGTKKTSVRVVVARGKVAVFSF